MPDELYSDQINDAYIDVDFEKELKKPKVRAELGLTKDGKKPFFSGNLGSGLMTLACGSFEDRATVIPRSQWDAEIAKVTAAGGGLERLVTRIYNQKSEGSCVANATSQAHEIVQAKQFGKDNVVHLSAMSLYKRIGRSPSSGAMVSDGLEEGAKRGMLPLDDPANRAKYGDKVMPNTGWSTPYPSEWEATAKRFRFTEWDEIRTVDGLGTALLTGFPVVVGRQGHSICYVGLISKDGKVLAPYPNSWGEWGSAFGDHSSGFGFDTESQIRMSASGAFTPRSIVVELP